MKTLERKKKITTSDEIASMLFYLRDVAHFFHLQTDTYAKHKMLNALYESIASSQDSICEFLLGVQAPKRFKIITIADIPMYSELELTSMLEQGFQFSIAICDYAEENKLEQLCNLASELQGAFVKAKLFYTYK
jgi:hypothetical protein